MFHYEGIYAQFSVIIKILPNTKSISQSANIQFIIYPGEDSVKGEIPDNSWSLHDN